MKTLIPVFIFSIGCLCTNARVSGPDASNYAVNQASKHMEVIVKCASSQDHYTFSPLKASVVPGTITKSAVAPQPGDFVVVMLDNKKNPIDTAVISKPFQPLPVNAPDDGTNKYRVVNKNSHQSVVQFDYHPDAGFIMISQVGKTGENTIIEVMDLGL